MICNYDEIIVLNNTLVCIDLDETIIHFPNVNQTWWEKTKKMYNLLNDTTSDEMVYRDWISIIYNNIPTLLDEKQFNNLMERVKNTRSKLVIITARNIKLEEITHKHLMECNINISDIYFSNKKGDIVNQIKRLHNGPIIFIDDLIKNINDVKNINPEVITYHMKHINL